MDYKLSLIIPSVYSPSGSTNCVDPVSEEFALYLKHRADNEFNSPCHYTQVPGTAYIHSFSAFEERFLVHSEYAVVIISPNSKQAISRFLPRLLVFLTERSIWQNRFLFVVIGDVDISNLVSLVIHPPIIFSLEDWKTHDEASWTQLFELVKVKWVPYIEPTILVKELGPQNTIAEASIGSSVQNDVKKSTNVATQGASVEVDSFYYVKEEKNAQKSFMEVSANTDDCLIEEKDMDIDIINESSYPKEEVYLQLDDYNQSNENESEVRVFIKKDGLDKIQDGKYDEFDLIKEEKGYGMIPEGYIGSTSVKENINDDLLVDDKGLSINAKDGNDEAKDNKEDNNVSFRKENERDSKVLMTKDDENKIQDIKHDVSDLLVIKKEKDIDMNQEGYIGSTSVKGNVNDDFLFDDTGVSIHVKDGNAETKDNKGDNNVSPMKVNESHTRNVGAVFGLTGSGTDEELKEEKEEEIIKKLESDIDVSTEGNNLLSFEEEENFDMKFQSDIGRHNLKDKLDEYITLSTEENERNDMGLECDEDKRNSEERLQDLYLKGDVRVGGNVMDWRPRIKEESDSESKDKIVKDDVNLPTKEGNKDKRETTNINIGKEKREINLEVDVNRSPRETNTNDNFISNKDMRDNNRGINTEKDDRVNVNLTSISNEREKEGLVTVDNNITSITDAESNTPLKITHVSPGQSSTTSSDIHKEVIDPSENRPFHNQNKVTMPATNEQVTNVMKTSVHTTPAMNHNETDDNNSTSENNVIVEKDGRCDKETDLENIQKGKQRNSLQSPTGLANIEGIFGGDINILYRGNEVLDDSLTESEHHEPRWHLNLGSRIYTSIMSLFQSSTSLSQRSEIEDIVTDAGDDETRTISMGYYLTNMVHNPSGVINMFIVVSLLSPYAAKMMRHLTLYPWLLIDIANTCFSNTVHYQHVIRPYVLPITSTETENVQVFHHTSSGAIPSMNILHHTSSGAIPSMNIFHLAPFWYSQGEECH